MAGLPAAALEYHRAGEQVIPLQAGAKIPAVSGWRKIRWTEDQVRALWSSSDYGIGLATGHGWLVIDVDTRNGGAIDASWPDTRTVRTPSGGWHLYYAYTGDPIRNSAGLLAAGVDVRGVGGLVVVPPTPGYELADDRPLTRLPSTVAVTLRRGRVRDGGTGSRGRFKWPDRLGTGERNSGLASIAGYLLATGLDDGAMAVELAEVNRWLCDPPLETVEVERIARSIACTHEARA